MTSAMTAFAIGVGVSAACYLLIIRATNRRTRGRSSHDGSGSDGWTNSDSDGGSMISWFGGHHSATDSSGNPFDAGESHGGGHDSGAGDSGGGDGGGDGGGGGGGSD